MNGLKLDEIRKKFRNEKKYAEEIKQTIAYLSSESLIEQGKGESIVEKINKYWEMKDNNEKGDIQRTEIEIFNNLHQALRAKGSDIAERIYRDEAEGRQGQALSSLNGLGWFSKENVGGYEIMSIGLGKLNSSKFKKATLLEKEPLEKQPLTTPTSPRVKAIKTDEAPEDLPDTEEQQAPAPAPAPAPASAPAPAPAPPTNATNKPRKQEILDTAYRRNKCNPMTKLEIPQYVIDTSYYSLTQFANHRPSIERVKWDKNDIVKDFASERKLFNF